MAGDIEVRRYIEEDHDRWDRFVRGSNNGTIFHEQQFLDYHPDGRFDFHHLIFEKDSNIFAVLPGLVKNGVFRSPAGASFGGFVTNDISYDTAEEIVDRFLDHCRRSGIREVYVTPPLSVYYDIVTQNIEYALLHRSFDYHVHLYSSVVDLRRTFGMEHYDKKARNAVRKALKSGITVEIENDFDTFYPILVENKGKFDLDPTHSLDELKRLDELLPGKLKLFMARMDGRVIGGSLIFVCNERTLIDFYIAQNYDYQEYRTINLVLHEIIRWGHENGYAYFDIGVNQDTSSSNPMDLNQPLVAFKYRMGARCVMRNTLYKNLRGDEE
ncbi:MAG: GNAT family N-acetyltransferase [Thermoplasmatota archaeon]